MRFSDLLLERLRAVPPPFVLGGLVAIQLVSLAVLARSGNWTFTVGDAALGAALVSAELGLLYAIGHTLGGRLFGLLAGLVWVAAPIVFLRYWVVGGSPPVDFTINYREQFLPAAFGFEAAGAVAASCLLLASAWLALAPPARVFIGGTVAGAAAGSAAGAAALAHPLVWPAIGAPILALAVARRPRAALACAAAALVGLAALALFRDVPGIHPGWHTMGASVDQFREFSWSKRVLEYLPLAGLVGLTIRSRPAAAFFGWLLLTTILFTLGRQLTLLPLLLALVPGLATYALLTASIAFLVPSRDPARATTAHPELGR